jgi:hypothetical protein
MGSASLQVMTETVWERELNHPKRCLDIDRPHRIDVAASDTDVVSVVVEPSCNGMTQTRFAPLIMIVLPVGLSITRSYPPQRVGELVASKVGPWMLQH